jgi:hypothetical protein
MCRDDQLAHQSPALVESSDQFVELGVFVVVPFRRNAPGNLTELRAAQSFFHAIQPRFERIDARDVPINAVTIIEPAQRRVGEIPFARIEAEALIDDHRLIARTAGLQEKNGLPPIGIACPFVEHQHACEISEILHLAKLFVRQKIEHVSLRWITRIARTELLSRPAWRAAHSQLDHQLCGKLDKFRTDLHHLDLRDP